MLVKALSAARSSRVRAELEERRGGSAGVSGIAPPAEAVPPRAPAAACGSSHASVTMLWQNVASAFCGDYGRRGEKKERQGKGGVREGVVLFQKGHHGIR
jgi:hypothetical protein